MASSESSQIRVLHVDDEPDLTDLAATFLERADERLAIETVTNADIGLALLSDNEFDCIISDYDMPERNGIEFLRAVRETHPELPFILYTGKGSEEVASEAISTGVSDYLQKETGTDQYTVLANRIVNLVSQYRAVSAVEEYASEREESEWYRQRLIEIISDPEVSDTGKIDQLLALGCERLGLENGHLVMINEEINRHEVVSVFGSEVVREGVTELSETYCRKTIESDGMLDVYHAGEQGWAGDTAYEAFGLECYIGGKLTGEGQLFGTLCFVDPDPREPFTPNEKAFFDLLVQWFSQMLERRRRLNQADVIFDHVQDAIFLIDVADEETFTISSVNQAYEDLTGYSSTDLQGETPRYLLGGEQGAEVEARFRECVEKREPIEYDEQLTLGDSKKYLHTRLAPVVEDSRVVQLIGAARDITGQREHQQELEAERRFISQAMNTLNDVFYVVGPDFQLQRWNERVMEVTGYAGTDIEAMNALEFFPEYEQERITESIETTLETGADHIAADIQVSNGSRIPYEFVSRRLTDSEGEIMGIAGIGRDISERKEREREYEQVVELLRHTEQIADVGGWEIDPETQDVFWSEHLFEMLEWEDDEEPPLENALDLYVEEDRPRVANAIEDALAAGESFAVEARLQRPNGEIRWFDIRGGPTMEDGEVVTLRGAVHDITAQKRRERVLREIHDIISNRHQSFEEQIQTLLELGRRELDTEYGTLSEIRGEEYIFEFVDADDDSIQPGDVAPVSATNCEIVASTEQTLVIGDIERDAPEETDRAGFTDWGISCYIGAPVFVEDAVYGTFCFYGTEARSDQFSEWETTLVELMSNWVSHELQRRETNERLQKQNEQLEQFASVVSHDLRNPLNVVEGRLELAKEECDSEHLDQMDIAIHRMDGIIEDVLGLAREGRDIGSMERVEIQNAVESAWNLVADNAEKAELRYATDENHLPTVRADYDRLCQLMENLLRNAVEHGGEDITVTVGTLGGGFYVEDDGPGIPEEERITVFEAGYSTKEGGTGFGLSIVKQVAEAHGWELRVTESSNGGTRFEITGMELSE